MDERPLVVSGVVARAALDSGSKSARRGIVLRADDGECYALRLGDAPAFGPNPLEDLVGETITTEGVAIDRTLIVTKWTLGR
ncbi:MAG: hypothetical protein EOP22_08530 [Hyphomicrobiales bacterium]|nr:MAG: hypothetical protein EOP22_08530 [Hyphomicrobiales bacterium]